LPIEFERSLLTTHELLVEKDFVAMARTIQVAAMSLMLGVVSGATSFAANVFIPATEVFATGVIYPFQIDRDWLPTDVLDIQATGLTCTLAGCEVMDNAGGIIAFDSGGSGVGNTDSLVYSYAEGAYQGGLILGIQPLLDGDRPWIQLIRPTAANGLGASIVPSIVTSTRTLAEYGGFLATIIPAGTTLYLTTADINHSDNSRSYLVSTVPEPSVGTLMLMALAAPALKVRFRRN
jgi:hypothetical protein